MPAKAIRAEEDYRKEYPFTEIIGVTMYNSVVVDLPLRS